MSRWSRWPGRRFCDRVIFEWIGMIVDNGDLFSDEFLYITEVFFFFCITESESDTAGSCSACSTDTVDIRFWDIWKLKIDDMSEFIDVDSSCCDVGGDEDTSGLCFEVFESCLTGILCLVSMNSLSINSHFHEFFDDFVSAMFCPSEDKDSLNVFIL